MDREAESFVGRGFSHDTTTSGKGAALAAEVQLSLIQDECDYRIYVVSAAKAG